MRNLFIDVSASTQDRYTRTLLLYLLEALDLNEDYRLNLFSLKVHRGAVFSKTTDDERNVKELEFRIKDAQKAYGQGTEIQEVMNWVAPGDVLVTDYPGAVEPPAGVLITSVKAYNPTQIGDPFMIIKF